MAFRFSAHDDGDLPVNHDINVTPFIDVMLVLLIIFMVAAPLATSDVKVDLPVAAAVPSSRPDKPVTVTIDAAGIVHVDNRALASPADLAGAVRAVAGQDAGQRIFLRADRTVTYDRVMEVMNGLRSAGFLKVALVGLDGGGTAR